MRSPKLTETNEWHGGGRLCHSYEWRGSSVPVCDSCRNMLLVIELFADESFEPDEKFDILMPMLFPEPARVLELAGAEIGELLKAVLWQACGLDVSGSGEEHPQKVFDWDEDAARIKASLMSAYGMRWADVADGCTFADACALLAMLMEDDNATPFQQAVYYRTAKPPKRTKGNSDYCDAWNERRRHFALRRPSDGEEDAATAQNGRSRDLFAALRAAAKPAEACNG